ncbi:MAG: ABC transporter permease [Planctomycetota bacterium]
MTNSDEPQTGDRQAGGGRATRRQAGVSSPLVELTAVRLKEHIRQPEALFWTLIFPLIMAVGLGLAFREQGPAVLPVGVLGEAVGGPAASASIGDADGRLDVTRYDTDTNPLRLIASGEAVLVVAYDAEAGSPTYWYDESNPEGRLARLIVDDTWQRSAGRADAFTPADRLVDEPGSRYIDFLIPGLVGLNLMGGSIWGVGFAIVDARRRKLLKRLAASPMARTHYLASYLISRMCVLVFEVVFLLLIGTFLFGVPFRGSVFGFATLCVFSALSFTAIGLLIAARPRTVQAVSGWMNFIMLPMWICSGVFFPPERFPEAVLPLIRALPLTAVIDALRANMLRGEPVYTLGWQTAVLTAWLVICFPLAVKVFRWK